MLTDTIVALATPAGRSALAIVRVSGKRAFEVAAKVVQGFRAEPAREARLAEFHDDAGMLDRGIYIAYPAPRSATGESVVEFICHGGLVVPVRLQAAIEKAGARPAHPGEFTRRAVEHGKLDLLQAEAVGDLIDAEVPAQARSALTQLEGGLSRRIARLRDGMIELLALLAYEVDFPDEDDGPIPRDRIEAARAQVAAEVEKLLATAPAAERLRKGALVVLAGPPNSGKSSLFNALLGTERALVTEIPGTTRDAIEAHADFFGWPIRLVDTAGLGEATDRLDAMGQAMGRRFVEGADLVIECSALDAQDSVAVPEMTPRKAAQSPSAERRAPSHHLLVHTKADLAPSETGEGGLRISSITGEGLEALKRAVVERLFREGAGFADIEPALTRERHRVALEGARRALEEAAPHLAHGGDAVLAAHHVQEAVRAVDGLIGAVDLDEVLDRVFASFCVGK